MEESITWYIDIRASRKAVDDIKVWGKIPRCAMRHLCWGNRTQTLDTYVMLDGYSHDTENEPVSDSVR